MVGSIILAMLLSYGDLVPDVKDITVETAYYQGESYSIDLHPLRMNDREGVPVLLEKQAAHQLKLMVKAARQDGIEININYGFRTNAQQKYWYHRYKWLCKNQNKKYCGMAAKPGWSSHQRGISIDIRSCTVFIPFEDVERSADYVQNMKKWVAGGGCREKEEGYLCYTKLYYWLLENGKKYGYRNDVPKEHWHFTYEEPSEIAIGG
jgi:LAS superfamily LD-carboxypeptidase LdcB